MFKNILIGSLVIVLFNGCLKKNDTNACAYSNYDPCALKAPASEIQAVSDYLTANGITATQHCSGLYYAIDAPGSGATPGICSHVLVKYEARLTNGTIVDSNSVGANFLLGQLISGWQAGIPLVKEGGSVRLYVPPSLGYGSSTYGPIPGNSILVFRIDLVKVY